MAGIQIGGGPVPGLDLVKVLQAMQAQQSDADAQALQRANMMAPRMGSGTGYRNVASGNSSGASLDGPGGRGISGLKRDGTIQQQDASGNVTRAGLLQERLRNALAGGEDLGSVQDTTVVPMREFYEPKRYHADQRRLERQAGDEAPAVAEAKKREAARKDMQSRIDKETDPETFKELIKERDEVHGPPAPGGGARNPFNEPKMTPAEAAKLKKLEAAKGQSDEDREEKRKAAERAEAAGTRAEEESARAKAKFENEVQARGENLTDIQKAQAKELHERREKFTKDSADPDLSEDTRTKAAEAARAADRELNALYIRTSTATTGTDVSEAVAKERAAKNAERQKAKDEKIRLERDRLVAASAKAARGASRESSDNLRDAVAKVRPAIAGSRDAMAANDLAKQLGGDQDPNLARTLRMLNPATARVQQLFDASGDNIVELVGKLNEELADAISGKADPYLGKAGSIFEEERTFVSRESYVNLLKFSIAQATKEKLRRESKRTGAGK